MTELRQHSYLHKLYFSWTGNLTKNISLCHINRTEQWVSSWKFHAYIILMDHSHLSEFLLLFHSTLFAPFFFPNTPIYFQDFKQSTFFILKKNCFFLSVADHLTWLLISLMRPYLPNFPHLLQREHHLGNKRPKHKSMGDFRHRPKQEVKTRHCWSVTFQGPWVIKFEFWAFYPSWKTFLKLHRFQQVHAAWSWLGCQTTTKKQMHILSSFPSRKTGVLLRSLIIILK